MQRRLVTALAVTVVALAGCGAAGQGDDDDNVDAGGSDAGGCTAFPRFEPTMPTAPATVIARGEVSGASGILTYTWRLERNGASVPFTPLDPDSRDIQFEALESGLYEAWLDVDVPCATIPGRLNVLEPGAQTRSVRLRFVPPTAITAPAQERTYVIPGGAAQYDIGTAILDVGNTFTVAVRTAQSAPVPAYLRFTSLAAPDSFIESFSDVNGNASVRLLNGRYDVLVVPASETLAPRVISNWDPITGSLSVDAGTQLTGTLLDASGTGLVGARVSIMSGGVPSTVATTTTGGAFSLRWREGAAIEKLTVVPAAGSDLPRLDAQVELGTMSSITIRHASLTASDVGNTLVRVGGSPVASTDVLVDLTVTNAGTIRDGGGTSVLAQATGSHRTTLRTDAGGRLPAATFADGSGAVFIASSGPGARAAITLPLGGAIDAAAPVTVSGRVLRSAGGARADARVRAVLTGPLAYTGAPVPTAVAGTDGRFTISLAAGASYALTLSDPTVDDAAIVVDVAAATAQDLGDRTLRAALALSGHVGVTGQSAGARSVGVSALCNESCTGIDRVRPLGDAVTDSAGNFVVAVPDPGVSPQ